MDDRNAEKTFREKMMILKGNISDPEIPLDDLESYPEDFCQLTPKQLFYLWHYLSDKKIAELYDVSEYTVKKQRHNFGINPVSSMFDRMEYDRFKVKIFTVSETKTDMLVAGSPQYPMWTSKEPDIYVSEIEYNDDEYNKIRAQANRWRIDLNSYQDDDHGSDQQSTHSDSHSRPIKDEEILVKEGSFFGIITLVDRSFYSKSSVFHKGYEYVSINTAHIRHGLWQYHYGHSSDNGSSDDDTVYYLRPLFEEK